MLTSIRMPKCTGSMPSRIAVGNRIGAMIRMIEDGSMKLPAISSSRLTTSRKPHGPRLSASIQSANAVLFSFVLANENIPNALADWMLALNLGPWGFLLVVNLLLLIAGNFMEPSSIILIMAPILFPTAMRLGIDPVHFGILIDVNMEVGLCHPPVGLKLYVASGISGLGITTLTQAVLLWLLTMLVFLVIVTYWPWLTLVVPRALNMM